MNIKTRLLICDDHPLLREGIKTTLGQQPTIEVVAEASNGREAVSETKRVRPDMVLMDMAMPELNGLEATLQIKEFDKDNDKAITAAEFTNPSTGKLYDPDLWKAMDSLGGPLSAGDPLRAGYMDNKIDNRDAYTKIRGEISIASTADAWKTNLASSGKTIRHRLNRGGDRQANAALYRIVVVRLRWHQPTRDYLARRLTEGKSKQEIIRCLKRYVAREVFAVLNQTGQDTSTAAA